MAPRVTVFIPTHNRADLLPESIESVLAQGFGDLALVVADNASTDETAEVVASFADERIRYDRRPENLGIFGNFDAALRSAATEYCVLLGDDDLLEPTFLAETVRVLDDHADAGIVHTAFGLISADGGVLERETDWTYGLTADTLESGRQFLAESMKWGCRVCSSATLIRTSAVGGGFEREDRLAFDFGLWLRMAVDWRMGFLARPLAHYRIHGASQTSAFGPPQGTGYVRGVDWVDERLDVKLRFLESYGDRLGDVRRLRRLAEQARRDELLVMVRKQTLPERKPAATVRSLARATRVEPRLVLEGAAWRLVVASLLTPRVVDRLKTLRHG